MYLPWSSGGPSETLAAQSVCSLEFSQDTNKHLHTLAETHTLAQTTHFIYSFFCLSTVVLLTYSLFDSFSSPFLSYVVTIFAPLQPLLSTRFSIFVSHTHLILLCLVFNATHPVLTFLSELSFIQAAHDVAFARQTRQLDKLKRL